MTIFSSESYTYIRIVCMYLRMVYMYHSHTSAYVCGHALVKIVLVQASSVPSLVFPRVEGDVIKPISHCNISQSVEATRFIFRIVRLLWNLTGTSAAPLSYFKAIQWFEQPISWLRDCTRYWNVALVEAWRMLGSNDFIMWLYASLDVSYYELISLFLCFNT